jgi:hypothetical protein
MAKQFLTGLDLNKNELLNARIQNLSSAPSTPVAGQIYYNTTDQTLRYYDGTGSAWVSLAIGGSVDEAITAAIDAIDTDVIEEGANNLYYTDARVDTYVSGSMSTDDLSEGSTNLYYTSARASSAAASLLTGASLTNITITGDGSGLTITAENGVADSDTDDLSEGSTNLYYTDSRARGAISSGDDYIVYNSGNGEITLDTANAATVAYVDQEVSDVNNTINGLTTTDIAEGTSLYYTDARARDAVASGDNTLTYNSATGVFTANTSTLALKSYVDSQIEASSQGLDVKLSVRAATTANITLSGTQTVDGVVLVAGDRVLVKNQTDASENGIYDVVDGGSWTRSADSDSDEEVTAGLFTFVSEGTSQADTGWVLSTNDTITVGTTNLTFTQFSGAGVISAGDGLVQNGTVFDIVGTSDRITVNSDSIDIASTYEGQSSIVTVGTITTGTWNGTTVDVAHGGTGQTTLASGEYLVGNGTGGITTSATIPVGDLDGTVAISQGGTGATTAAGARSNLGATTKYAASNAEITPSSGTATWAVSHSLNSSDVVVSVRDLSDNSQVEVDVVHSDANTITLSWNSATTVAANSYRVVVVG